MQLISFLFPLIWLLLPALEATCSNSCNISSGDYISLYSLFESTHGPGWTYNASHTNNSRWNFDGYPTFPPINDPCKQCWYGVICVHVNSTTCAVQKLLLQSINILGTLPPIFWNLQSLAEFDASFNSINGSVSTSIVNSSSLTKLVLYGNMLTGSLPEEIFLLPNIEVVNMSFNSLTGYIPSNIGIARNLSSIYLSGNSLNGNLPDSIRNLTGLVNIGFDSNFFSGSVPKGLFASIITLRYCNLAYNKFTGPAVGFDGTTQGLDYQIVTVNISNNGFSGPFPEYLNCKKLEYLALNNNSFSSTFPSSMGYLTSLQYLFLYDNKGTGTVPTTLNQLSSLVTIVIGSNSFNGSIDVFDPQVLINL